MRVRRAILILVSVGLSQCSNEPDRGPDGEDVVGAPCTPSLEKDPNFNGFRITETTIETGSPECGTGVCLMNHFQGRVSCPLGQPAPEDGAGGPDGCQRALAPGESKLVNVGKACCVPGTDTPVEVAVCGQCVGAEDDSSRDAEDAAHCTCRCGVADGEPDDPDFDFCTCPDGFECSEIVKNVGLGDPDLTGKYCIRAGTAYRPNDDQCVFVDGTWVSGASNGLQCAGAPTNKCVTPGGPCDD